MKYIYYVITDIVIFLVIYNPQTCLSDITDY